MNQNIKQNIGPTKTRDFLCWQGYIYESQTVPFTDALNINSTTKQNVIMLNCHSFTY